MPFYLKDTNFLPQVSGLQSVLIVPCRFCPAASLAVRNEMPYIELFKRFLRTKAYESFIKELEHQLIDHGIKTAVFESKWLHQYVGCMWTASRREELAKRATDFDGALVLGCDAMVDTVRDAIQSTDCQVIKGMEAEGVMNVLPSVKFPFNLSLKLRSVTPVITKEAKEV